MRCWEGYGRGRALILGANIWASGGYERTLFEFAFDDQAQDFAFNRFIAQRGFRPDEDVTAWDEARGLSYAAYYNGPGNPSAYWNEMKTHFE